jgi:hypothetical protein
MPRLTTFSDYAKDFKSVYSVTAKGASAAPLADYFLKIGPPWPAYAIPPATTIVELICLVCIFQFFLKKEKAKLSQYLIISVIVFFLSSYLYLGMTSSYTFRQPKTGELMVKGFELTPEVKRVIGPDYPPEDALKGNRYDPEGVWTTRSITAMRLSLVAIWLLMFVSLSSFLGMFVVIQEST